MMQGWKVNRRPAQRDLENGVETKGASGADPQSLARNEFAKSGQSSSGWGEYYNVRRGKDLRKRIKRQIEVYLDSGNRIGAILANKFGPSAI